MRELWRAAATSMQLSPVPVYGSHVVVEDVIRFVRVNPDSKRVFDDVADDVFDGPIDPVLLDTVVENGQLIVVATHSETVVGQIQAMVHHHLHGPPQLYIDNLGVSPEYRRRGIARALFDEVIGWSAELGCQEAWVLTEIDNSSANAFYVSLRAERSNVALYSMWNTDK